ncbi:MAG: hypothetical protein ACXVIP_02055 [Halobacteriota archaeon]
MNQAKIGYCKYGAGLCQFRIELGNLKTCRRCLDSTVSMNDSSCSVCDAFATSFTS